jgi:glycosyltransferase involved in cell wall biosynthesis
MSLSNSVLVSVVIPTHNRPHLLTRTVNSVLAQTIREIEVVIVDDCSDVPAESQLPEDSRIHHLRHLTNKGGSAARNTGIAAAKGKYVALVDDDDTWHPTKLEKQVEALRKAPAAGFCYTWASLFQGEEVVHNWNHLANGSVLEEMLQSNFICSATPLIRRDVFDAVGSFDESFVSCQDWEMWVRIAAEFPFVCVKQDLATTYHHSGQRIGTSAQALRGYEQFIERFLPHLESRPAILARHLEFIGYEHYKQGNLLAANEYLSRALSANPFTLRGRLKKLIVGFSAMRSERVA